MLEIHENYLFLNERYPHVGRRLREAWGTVQFMVEMEELLHNTRNRTRQGFPFEALLAIDGVLELHRLTFPHLHPTSIFDA